MGGGPGFIVPPSYKNNAIYIATNTQFTYVISVHFPGLFQFHHMNTIGPEPFTLYGVFLIDVSQYLSIEAKIQFHKLKHNLLHQCPPISHL